MNDKDDIKNESFNAFAKKFNEIANLVEATDETDGTLAGILLCWLTISYLGYTGVWFSVTVILLVSL